MSELLKSVNGPGVQGLHPADYVITVRTSEDLAQYDLVQFDFNRADTAQIATSVQGVPGNANGVFYNVRLPDANATASNDSVGSGELFASKKQTRGGIFGVAQESAASLGTARVLVYGITPVVVASTASAHFGGEMYTPPSAGGNKPTRAAASSLKIIGIVTEPALSSATSVKVWFNGLTGFGVDAT